MRDQCLIIKLFNWTISVVNPVGCNRPTPNFHGNQHKLMQQHTKQWIYYEHRFSARLFQVSFYPIYFPIPFNLVTKYGTNNQVFCFYGSHFLYFIMNLASRFITKIILQQKIFYFMTISDFCSFEICTTIIFGNLTKSLMIFGWTAYSAWLVSSKNLRGCF